MFITLTRVSHPGTENQHVHVNPMHIRDMQVTMEGNSPATSILLAHGPACIVWETPQQIQDLCDKMLRCWCDILGYYINQNRIDR